MHQDLESLQPIGMTSPGTKEGIREEKLKKYGTDGKNWGKGKRKKTWP